MKEKANKKLSCISCGLREGCLSPKMQPYGNGKKGILIIGEAPGKVEDERDLPWQGKTGRLLQQTLSKLGVRLFEDCLCINAVNCRPPNNRSPKPNEIDCCRVVLVEKTIAEFKPKVILLLGSSAVQSFLSKRWPTDLGGIMKWRGFQIPDRDYKCWVVPAFHPSYVLRIDSREAQTIWEQDLIKAIGAAEQKFPKFPEPDIRIIEDLSVLTQYTELSEMAFDYETTGLKSQGRGHKIVCASVAVNESLVYAFMMPPAPAQFRPFKDLLTNADIGKMAHHMKFEDAWTRNKLRTEIKNWQWDSMLAAHILDNRSGITGLKFQTYVNFGVVDYASEITPYLRADGSGNTFNSIYKLVEEEGGKEKLLRYCAFDSHYEYNLAKLQMKKLEYSYLPF